MTRLVAESGKHNIDALHLGRVVAKEGVSLDKIAAWMGNSPQICRRHYAQFAPRDRHDEGIERL